MADGTPTLDGTTVRASARWQNTPEVQAQLSRGARGPHARAAKPRRVIRKTVSAYVAPTARAHVQSKYKHDYTS